MATRRFKMGCTTVSNLGWKTRVKVPVHGDTGSSPAHEVTSN